MILGSNKTNINNLNKTTTTKDLSKDKIILMIPKDKEAVEEEVVVEEEAVVAEEETEVVTITTPLISTILMTTNSWHSFERLFF